MELQVDEANENIGSKNNIVEVDNADEAKGEKGVISAVKDVWIEFCNSSSIHGVRYVSTKKTHERICWIIVCIISLTFCCTQIYITLRKWKENPIEMVMERKYTPIKDVLFPAITFCGQQMGNRSLYNYSKTLLSDSDFPFKNHTIDEQKYFDFVSQRCWAKMYKNIDKLDNLSARLPEEGRMANNEDFSFIKSFFPEPKQVFHNCYDNVANRYAFWDCGRSFHRILTAAGVCYTFNMQPKKNIFYPGVVYDFMENPYLIQYNLSEGSTNIEEPEVLESKTYPYRVTSNRHVFTFVIGKYKDFTDEVCNPGLRIFVHENDELPWDVSQAHAIDSNLYARTRITIKPNQVLTSDDLRKGSNPKERLCYFGPERKLNFTNRYRKRNCDLECWLKTAIKNCECVPFWVPRQENIRICTTADMYCIDEALVATSCGCLPECNSMRYDLKIKRDWARHNSEFDAVDDQNRTLELSFFEFHFERSEFLAMKRVSAYTMTDFVAQVGGIFGLFLGFSLLSMVEIVYFLTVRLILKVKSSFTPKE